MPAFSHKTELSLAAHLENGSSLSKPGETRLRGVVEEALRIAEDKGAEDIIAFATSAVRDAVNGEQVLARIREQTGAQINVMTGLEEARLTFLAARRWFGWSSGRLLVIDIGGGSLEVASGLDEEPDAVASLPLGAGRLTRDWIGTDPPSAQEVRRLRKHVRAEIAREAGGMLRDGPPDHVVGTSKTFRQLARIAGAAPSGEGLYVTRVLRHADVAALAERLPKLSQAERIKLPGVSAGRVAQLPAGAIIADAILDLLGVDQLELCPWALREGVILRRLDMLAQGLGALPVVGRPASVVAARHDPDAFGLLLGVDDRGAGRGRWLVLGLNRRGRGLGRRGRSLLRLARAACPGPPGTAGRGGADGPAVAGRGPAGPPGLAGLTGLRPAGDRAGSPAGRGASGSPAGRGAPLGSGMAVALAVAWSTSSSSDMRAVSAVTRPETPSRISVSRFIVSACLVDSRFRRRSAPSWMAVARAVASSSAFLAWALALASALSDFLRASVVVRSASVRAPVRVFSASLRAPVTVFSASARAEVIARSACSWAAVSMRSACSRASVLVFSASDCASLRCRAISSCAFDFWDLASSSASLRIWAMRSLTSSCAGLAPSACWRAEASSRLSSSPSSRARASRCSRSRIWLRQRAMNSST